jgi:mono/diheme cytochrome c family protein
MLVVIGGCSDRSVEPSISYQPSPHLLATGDPVAGRKAFLELQCESCHTVAGDDFGFDAAGTRAPRLGRMQSTQSAEALASSIVLPAHSLSKRTGPWQQSAAEMKDYSEVMTVRQLLDIVAYLRDR